MRKTKFYWVLLAVMLSFTGCTTETSSEGSQSSVEASKTESAITPNSSISSEIVVEESSNSTLSDEDFSHTVEFDFSSVPEYSGSPYFVVNGNTPFFEVEDFEADSFEFYSELDSLGRCGVTLACIGTDIMPTEDRGAIGSIKPTGWHSVKYDCVDGKYLYNRCHLIGYQLTGENDNVQNLITGTRSLNMDGMLPFENLIADFVVETDMHVMYRVTPHFDGDNLLASGVLLEGMSVEDGGEGVLFNVYAYNAQPEIGIDYATGDSWLINNETATTVVTTQSETEEVVTEATKSYILNTSSKKVHKPSCSSVDTMSEENKQAYEGTMKELTEKGYEPCGRCNPS